MNKVKDFTTLRHGVHMDPVAYKLLVVAITEQELIENTGMSSHKLVSYGDFSELSSEQQVIVFNLFRSKFDAFLENLEKSRHS